MQRRALFLIALLFIPGHADADGTALRLLAPSDLVETGLLDYLLPRFSLKTGIKVDLVESEAEATFGEQGAPVFRGAETLWHLSTSDTAPATRFAAWLTSDIGKRAIESYPPDGPALYSAAVGGVDIAEPVALTGDAEKGAELSLTLCGRCHVIGPVNRMKGVGSSPSFPLLRTFGDWQARFETFFLLKPHPAFTQIRDVTEPFDPALPSPIEPLHLEFDDIGAILAYVAGIAPADLGAPVQSLQAE